MCISLACKRARAAWSAWGVGNPFDAGVGLHMKGLSMVSARRPRVEYGVRASFFAVPRGQSTNRARSANVSLAVERLQD